MTIFSITPDNNIAAHATEAEAKSITEAEQFSNAKELAKLAAKCQALHQRAFERMRNGGLECCDAHT